METKSVTKNLFYNLSLNFINVMFPLITAPFVSRILGADNLGKYSFSITFANWFLILATFGTTSYGIREISKIRDDKTKLNQTFSEIFFINSITTFISTLIYIIVIFSNRKTSDELLLFTVSSMMVFLNLFCVDWFYMGIENFKQIALRSLAVKIICIICIFTLVRNRNDYIVYSLIMVLAFGLANIFNFIYSKRYVKLIYKGLNLRQHFSKLIVFFKSSLVISIYSSLDLIFLGFISTNTSVAFYSRSKQIYIIALSLTLSISTVLLPKFTHMCHTDFDNYVKQLKKSINYIYIFSIPLVFGLIILSKEIMLFFGGKEFESANVPLIIVASSIFTVSLGNWQLNQLLLPLGEEKVGLKGQMIIAAVSIVLNILLVPRFSYVGSSISLMVAETSGTLYGTYYIKNKVKRVKIKYLTKGFFKYLIAALAMSFVLLVLKRIVNYEYLESILYSIVLGPITYFLILYLLKEDVIKDMIRFVKNKL